MYEGMTNSRRRGSSSSGLLTQLSSGQATVVVTVPGASATSATVECSSVPGGWANELNDSEWISANSPIASCTSDKAAGQYRYDVTFDVTGRDNWTEPQWIDARRR